MAVKKVAAQDSTAHYVDNKEFLAALIEHRDKVKLSKASNGDVPMPRVSEYIGDCFLRIATHLSYKLNFSSYTYREDMIADGVENSLCYINNFDPEKSSNPFSYFTQIVFYAFIRRIKKEKKQLYIKFASMQYEKLLHNDEFPVAATHQNTEYERFAAEFVDNYIIAKRKKRTPKKTVKTLEPFLEDE